MLGDLKGLEFDQPFVWILSLFLSWLCDKISTNIWYEKSWQQKLSILSPAHQGVEFCSKFLGGQFGLKLTIELTQRKFLANIMSHIFWILVVQNDWDAVVLFQGMNFHESLKPHAPSFTKTINVFVGLN